MIPLNQSLPLRTTAQWNGYKEVAAIPIPYGTATYLALQYNQQRTRFVISADKITSVVSVKIGDSLLSADRYETVAGFDPSGRPLQFLDLEPVDTSEDVCVTVIGVPGLDNPALWLQYVLNNIMGYEFPTSSFSQLANQSKRLNKKLSGIINTTSGSARSYIESVLDSIGARLTLNTPQLGIIYPVTDTYLANARIVETYDASNVNIRTSWNANLADVANEITVEFDYDNCERQPRGQIVVEAARSIQRYGLRRRTIRAHNVATNREAYDRAIQELRAYSTPPYKGQLVIDAPCTYPCPGDLVELVDSCSPVSGVLPVITSSSDYTKNTTSLTVEYFQELPGEQYQVVSQGALFPDLDIALDVKLDDSIATIKATNKQGGPLAGAVITLGSDVRIADDQGLAVFTNIAPGTYPLLIQSPGFEDQFFPAYELR